MGKRPTIVFATCTAAALFVAGCANQAKTDQGETRVIKGAQAPGRIEIPPAPPAKQVPIDSALRDEAKREIASALLSDRSVVRAHAVEAAKEGLGASSHAVILKTLDDADPMVRFAAAMAAGEQRVAGALPRLRELVKDPNPHVRIGAAFALHRMGDTTHSALLETAVRSTDAGVRANAAFALGRLGEPSAVKVLYVALRDMASPEVRLQAAEALWRLGNEDGLRALVAATLSVNPAHQIVAIQGLAGRRDDRVIQHVRAGLDSKYMEIILVTARALGMLGSDEAYSAAIDATKSADARQRYLAAMALGAIGRADAQSALATLFKDADPDVRLAAASAILQLKGS